MIYKGGMSEMINIKVDPRMKAAILKAAEKQIISMSAFIKQAIQKQLEEQGIDWRKEKGGPSKKPKS
jgi:hypothetical protein